MMNAVMHLYDLPHRRFTVTEYHRMGEIGMLEADERIELLEGELVDMAPIGGEHADFVDRLNFVITRTVPTDVRVRIQNPITLGDRSEPQPDVVLARAGDYRYQHPSAADVLLLIEVADTTVRRDRDIKIPLYARHGIPECWLFDLPNRKLEVFRQPSADGYRLIWLPEPTETLTPGAVPELTLSCAQLWE